MLGVRGQFHLSIDDKGRLSLPSKLRDALRVRGVDGLIVTQYKQGLWGYIEDDWVRYEQALEENPFDEKLLQVAHAFFAQASELEVDKQGRILVPPYLRRYGGLEKEVVLISLLDRIEIWSLERWEQVQNSARDQVDQENMLSQLRLSRGKSGG